MICQNCGAFFQPVTLGAYNVFILNEIGSEHVIGKAISHFAVNELGCELKLPKNFQSVPGCGIFCEISGKQVVVGKINWVIEQNNNNNNNKNVKISSSNQQDEILEFEKRGEKY